MISPRRYYQRLDGISAAGPRLGTKQWVLSRGCMRFVRLDFSSVPKARRAAALTLELMVHKPYAETDGAVIWQGGWAAVWLWDATLVRDAMASQDAKVRTVLPESVLYPALAEGSRLLRCLDGFEAQHWQSGMLVSSRWWPTSPEPQDWLAFWRDAGVVAGACPEPESLPLLRQPVGEVLPIHRSGAVISDVERAVYAGLAALLAYGAVDHVLTARHLAQETQRLEQTVQTARETAGPMLDAKIQAETALERVTALSAMDTFPDQLRLLAEIGRMLPNQTVVVQSWEYQAGKLKVTLQSPTTPLSATQLVETLQQSALFSNPKAIVGADPRNMSFQMDVNPVSGSVTGTASSEGKS